MAQTKIDGRRRKINPKRTTVRTVTIGVASENLAVAEEKTRKEEKEDAIKESVTSSSSSSSKTANNNDNNNDNNNNNDMVDLTATDDDDDDDDDEQNMKMPAKWKCPRCTSLNNNCASICIACDYNPIEDGNNDNDNNDSNTVWKCLHCTLNNPTTLSECDACGQSSPVAIATATIAAAVAATSSINDDVKDEDQSTAMMASSSSSSFTTSTKKKKRKKSDVATNTNTTSTKRVKRESSARTNADVANYGNDDVVVSAVVESRTITTNRDRRDRRNNNRKSAPPRIVTTGSATTTHAATAGDDDNNDDKNDDDDDDVVLEAVINGMKLPHSREDCLENIFSNIDTTTSLSSNNNNKAFKGTKKKVLLSKKNNNNVCDCCYCYVCDSPAKDCQTWYLSSSNSARHNHCCARANIQPWKSLRDTHKVEADAAKAATAATARKMAAIALAAGAAAAAAVGARYGATITTARQRTPRAPVGRHFMNKCRHYPRGKGSTGICGKCWCYVCNNEGSSCSSRRSHVIADPTMLIWRQQREMMENKLAIEVQPTYGEKGPFEPNDNNALQDSILDTSLIQCRHCKWFMRLGKPPRRHHPYGPALDDYMTQRMNSISNADWCLKCGLVASENDLEKDQAGTIPTDAGIGGNSIGNKNNDVKAPLNAPGTSVQQQQAGSAATTQSSFPFLLGTKEISFTIKPHDPRKMDRYKGNWKEYAKDGGWVYDLAKQKEEVFLHRIGKNPRLKNLLERAASVSPAHIPTDEPKYDEDVYSRAYTRGTPATIDDTDAIIIKDQQHLQLLNLLRHLDERQGIANLEVSWDASHSSGTITLNLYLPRNVFVLSTGVNPGFNIHHGINWQTLIQPAIISLWFGIKFSAGGLCGSLKISPSPKVKYDTSKSKKVKVPSKLQNIVIDSNLLRKSEYRLKKGHRQIETDIENISLQEAQSLTTSYNGPQRYLYHGGMVVNDTSLMKNMTRYFREMFPHMIDSSQSDEIMLSIHHGHQISNHRSHNNECLILDALIGVKNAVVARTGFSKDARDAINYKQSQLAYQDRVAQTVVCFESLGHAAEDHVDGLEIELLEFQKQALKWAVDREQMPGGIQSFFWSKVSNDLPLYYNPILHQFREDPPAVVRGGFLAQEMGLGKTVISLALILKNPAPANPPSGSPISMLETANPPPMAAAAATTTSLGGNKDVEIGWNEDLYKNTSGINKKRGSILCGGTLVICPVSLVGQWIEEARSKLSDPGLVYPYHGQGRLRNSGVLSKNSIVVTTYNVVASDAFYHSAKGGTDYCPPLEMIRWWRIIADEGHCLKENQTNIWKSCSQLVSDHKWIVTGTPLSTKVFDVKHQLAFLGIEHVNKIMQLCGTTSSGGRSYAANTVVPEHIMYLLKPIVLRHAQNQKYSGTETTLMSLPPKKERIQFIDFDNEEKEEFDIIEKKAKQFYLSFRAQHASTMSKYFLKVSQKLTPLRVACSGGKYPLENEDKINEHDTDIEDNDSDDEDQKKKKKKPAVKIYSEFTFRSKFRFLLQELEIIRDNDVSSKSLVFSQFNSTLEYLQTELPKHGFQFRTLSGSMSMKQRAKALRDFQNDPPTTVFLLSMRAGAVGINLTQANRVFLMEPSFNPALEAQAIGRVHRLGQKREVNILRLVIKNSFEDRMMKFLRQKYHHNDHKKSAEGGDDDDDDDGDDNNKNGDGNDEDRERSDGEGDGIGDSTEEKEKKDDNNDGNEIGPVGNIFREKAEIMIEEFDLLFGVDSIVKQQTQDGVAPDQIGSAEDGGTAPAPDHTASSFAPDHVVS